MASLAHHDKGGGKKGQALPKSKAPTPALRDCAGCGASEGSIPGTKVHRACGGCKITYYCSSDCQEEHWKKGGHKTYCLALQKSQGSAPNLGPIATKKPKFEPLRTPVQVRDNEHCHLALYMPAFFYSSSSAHHPRVFLVAVYIWYR